MAGAGGEGAGKRVVARGEGVFLRWPQGIPDLEFIIIGLTGRTGSGCTTVSNILAAPSFDKLHLQSPKDLQFKSNEERKYKVIYSYAEKHWKPFRAIEMTSILTSFLVERGYKHKICT